jgi:hypothetical protein
MLPLGTSSSRTWRARDDSGRVALLREVPEGQSPTLSTSQSPGLVHLREVVALDGKRYGVWDFVEAESLREVTERLLDAGISIPLGVLARVVIDASRALVAVTPGRPHGGLSDASLLLSPNGTTRLMDFGAPRPGRFTPHGPPSFANDVFAMGALLHAALTGFGGSYADALEDGLSLPAPSQLHDDCTPAVDDVIQRAIARSVEARQPDLELFADELEAVLGEALATTKQVAALLRTKAVSGPPVPDEDPGPALGVGDDAPTGQHPMPGASQTVQGLEPVAPIPMGTQPGTPPGNAFHEVSEEAPKPFAGIPLSTQPGTPGPALGDAPPEVTQPRISLPRTISGRVPKAAAPPPPDATQPVALDTQPRIRVPDTAEDEMPTGATPMPAEPSALPRGSRLNAPGPQPAGAAPPRATRSNAPVLPSPSTPDPASGGTAPRRASRSNAPVLASSSTPDPTGSQPPPSGGRAAPRASRSNAPVLLSSTPDPTGSQPPPSGGTAAPRASRSKAPVLSEPDVSHAPPTPPSAGPAPRASRANTPGLASAPPLEPNDASPPTGTNVSHAKLEWAATQARVPTPPFGVPALGDEVEPEPTNVKARPGATSGTAPSLDSVPSLESPAAGADELPPASGRGRRGLIAVLLVVVAGLFGAFAWKKQAGGSDVVVEQIAIFEEDAGVEPSPVVDAGEASDAGDAAPDAAEDASVDEEDESDVDGGSEVEDEPGDEGSLDAGAADAGVKKQVKKKPTKKKRRR